MSEIETGVTRILFDASGLCSRHFAKGYYSGLTLFSFSEISRRWIPDNRIQPGHNIYPAANFFAARERCADSDKTSDGRENRQRHQRHPHRLRRLMRNTDV